MLNTKALLMAAIGDSPLAVKDFYFQITPQPLGNYWFLTLYNSKTGEKETNNVTKTSTMAYIDAYEPPYIDLYTILPLDDKNVSFVSRTNPEAELLVYASISKPIVVIQPYMRGSPLSFESIGIGSYYPE